MAAVPLLVFPFAAFAQAGATASEYVTKGGDDLLTMAEQLRPAKATMNQMALSLARANMGTLKGRPGLPPPEGTRLTVPSEATVLTADPRAAEVEVAKIWRGEQYYKAAQALEQTNDIYVAFDTYTYAAALGHGPSQLRLGQIYDRGVSGLVSRDYLESIRWYERARKQKVPFDLQRGRSYDYR